MYDYEVVQLMKGRQGWRIDGYEYIKNRSVEKQTYLRCRWRKICHARAIIIHATGKARVPENQTHTHPPPPESKVVLRVQENKTRTHRARRCIEPKVDLPIAENKICPPPPSLEPKADLRVQETEACTLPPSPSTEPKTDLPIPENETCTHPLTRLAPKVDSVQSIACANDVVIFESVPTENVIVPIAISGPEMFTPFQFSPVSEPEWEPKLEPNPKLEPMATTESMTSYTDIKPNSVAKKDGNTIDQSQPIESSMAPSVDQIAPSLDTVEIQADGEPSACWHMNVVDHRLA